MIRADAAFEAALGIALLAGFGAADFPHPVGRVVVVVVGVLLLGVAAVLWTARVRARTLAAGNLATAAAAVAWLALASGFSAAGTALLMATVGALVALALAELRL